MEHIKHKSAESMEDYLEAIFVLSHKQESVRSIDLANYLNYSKPSISVAMKNLKNRNYIKISSNGFIQLTDEGMFLASKVYERHTLLMNWLISLGVSPETAAADACRIEHDISQESFLALKSFIEKKSNIL